jgi:hypothetical protein
VPGQLASSDLAGFFEPSHYLQRHRRSFLGHREFICRSRHKKHL